MVLELRAQILKADFLPLNLDSKKCHLCDISPSLDFLLGKTRKHSTMPFIKTAIAVLPGMGENAKEKGKENGVLWSGIQQQSHGDPVHPEKPVLGALALPSNKPSICLFHWEIPVPISTSFLTPPFHIFTSLSFSPPPAPHFDFFPPALLLYIPSPEQQ